MGRGVCLPVAVGRASLTVVLAALEVMELVLVAEVVLAVDADDGFLGVTDVLAEGAIETDRRARVAGAGADEVLLIGAQV